MRRDDAGRFACSDQRGSLLVRIAASLFPSLKRATVHTSLEREHPKTELADLVELVASFDSLLPLVERLQGRCGRL